VSLKVYYQSPAGIHFSRSLDMLTRARSDSYRPPNVSTGPVRKDLSEK